MEERQVTATGDLMGTTKPNKKNYAQMGKILQKSIEFLIDLEVSGEVNMDLRQEGIGMSVEINIDEKTNEDSIKVGHNIEITDPTSCMQGDVMEVMETKKTLLRLMSSRGTYHIVLRKSVSKTTKSFKTRWLTNIEKSDAEPTLDKLNRGAVQRALIIGQPKSTKEYTTNELLRMNLVGVYDLGNV